MEKKLERQKEKEYVKSGYKAVSDYFGGEYEDRLWKTFEAGKLAIDELLRELGGEKMRKMKRLLYIATILPKYIFTLV